MAIMVLTNAQVKIGGNDLSAYCTSATLTYNVTVNDSTVMGATTHGRIAGLKDWKLDVELEQDYAVGTMDSLLFPLVGTSVAVLFKAVNDANTTSSPQYSGNAILDSYQPVSGKVGDLVKTPVSLVANGALSRLTS